jgi:hypothetical protein
MLTAINLDAPSLEWLHQSAICGAVTPSGWLRQKKAQYKTIEITSG